MNYFQGLCYVFGAMLILTRPAMHLFPKRWNEFELKKAYTKKRPKWIWTVSGLGVFIIGFTQYKHFTTDVPYSLVITLILSLTLVKTSQVLFNYQKFREFAVRVLEKDRKTLVFINTAATILGLAVLTMGLFLY